MKIDPTLTREQIIQHLNRLQEAQRTSLGINWPWPIENEIKAYEGRLKELAPEQLLVFDTYEEGIYTLRNPYTNDVWTFTNAIEAKFFVDAFYAEDLRLFIGYKEKAA